VHKWLKMNKNKMNTICLNSKGNEVIACCLLNVCDTPLHSLKDSNANPKVETTERVEVHSLACSTLGVEGCARVPRWGLEWVTNDSIIYTNLHKFNNKLVIAWLEHFWCTNKSQAYTNSQIQHGSNLGEATTFPFIVFFVPGHEACT
jgi:hypothetical protein